MRKIHNKYTFILALFLSLGILACEDEQDGFTKFDQSYVAFSSDVANIQESQTVTAADGQPVTAASTYRVEVVRSSTDISSPLTVGIAAQGVYTDSTGFALPGDDASSTFNVTENIESVTIPAGEVSTSFLVVTKNDVEPSGNKQITLSIQSVSDPSYQIGLGTGENRRKGELNITVVDDDCPIDLSEFEGEWVVKSLCAAPGSFNDGFCKSTDVVGQIVTLTADPSDPLGTTAILSGGIHADDVVLKFNTCPKTVAIDDDYTLAFNQNGAPAFMGPPDEPEKYGTGSYNEDSKKISIVFTYGNTAGSRFDEFVVEYEKK